MQQNSHSDHSLTELYIKVYLDNQIPVFTPVISHITHTHTLFAVAHTSEFYVFHIGNWHWNCYLFIFLTNQFLIHGKYQFPGVHNSSSWGGAAQDYRLKG